MKKITYYLAIAMMLSFVANANAASISIVDDPVSSFFDVFYDPTPGLEFNAWDLVVTPVEGGILDSNQNAKSADTTNFPAPVDTFANTVFSAVGAGAANYIITDYQPWSGVSADSGRCAARSPADLDDL